MQTQIEEFLFLLYGAVSDAKCIRAIIQCTFHHDILHIYTIIYAHSEFHKSNFL